MAPSTINPQNIPASSSSSAVISRPRQPRRKPNDDAAYFGPSTGGNMTIVPTAGTKRHAGERIEGDPRIKRKRVDVSGASGGIPGAIRRPEREGVEGVGVKTSLVKFTNMPMDVLYRYLSHYDLVPPVYPSPLTGEDPAPPSSLLNDMRHRSPTPNLQGTTPANRPRRESKEQSRRRSSRLAEEEVIYRTPVLADVDEVHRVLAGIAERHFREEVRGVEVDILASFMCKVRGRL